MLTRIVANGNIFNRLRKIVRGTKVNRQWMEIRGGTYNIQRCLREIGHSGAKIVRAGRDNIFVEVHRDELKWLQSTAKDMNLRTLNAKEPTYDTALCGAFSINVTQHQVACTACAEVQKESEATMSQKRLFRSSDRATAIRAYAIKFPTAALDTFIQPLQEQGWKLGHNRTSQMKTLDNALRPYRGAPSNQRGYLLKGRTYASATVLTEPPFNPANLSAEEQAEVGEVFEVFEGVATALISTVPDPGIDIEDLVGSSDIEAQGTPETVHINVEKEERDYAGEAAERAGVLMTDSVLITTLDGLVKMAQERADEHMTLAAQWETIKGTITSLISEGRESEEQLRIAQDEVDATQRKLNAVVAAMGDNQATQG
jgi:hypothetical protein